ASRLGLAGLLLASVMAGLILLGMGAFGFGRLIQFIPHPVTTGFTAGIAVVIATLQLKDFFGLTVPHPAAHYVERVVALARAARTVSWPDLAVGLFTITLLFTWPKLTKRVPGALVAVSLGAALAGLLGSFGHCVETIGTKFTYA